jgi:hypothetical protein
LRVRLKQTRAARDSPPLFAQVNEHRQNLWARPA